MKTLLLTLLPLLFFSFDSQACSLAPNFAVVKKNEMVVEALNHMGVEIQDAKDLTTSDYDFQFFWTFSDPGFECHDTEKGSVNVSFSSDKISGSYAAFYDQQLKSIYDSLVQAGDWEAIAELDSKMYSCEVIIHIVHTLQPTSKDEPGYPMNIADTGTAVCKK